MKCLTQDGLKSQLPTDQPLPQAGRQREHRPLFPGGQESLRKGYPRLPWDPQQPLAHSHLQQSPKAEHEPAEKRREQMPAQTRGGRQEQTGSTSPGREGQALQL